MRSIRLALVGLGVVPQNDDEKAWPSGHAGLGLVLFGARIFAAQA